MCSGSALGISEPAFDRMCPDIIAVFHKSVMQSFSQGLEALARGPKNENFYRNPKCT